MVPLSSSSSSSSSMSLVSSSTSLVPASQDQEESQDMMMMPMPSFGIQPILNPPSIPDAIIKLYDSCRKAALPVYNCEEVLGKLKYEFLELTKPEIASLCAFYKKHFDRSNPVFRYMRLENNSDVTKLIFSSDEWRPLQELHEKVKIQMGNKKKFVRGDDCSPKDTPVCTPEEYEKIDIEMWKKWEKITGIKLESLYQNVAAISELHQTMIKFRENIEDAYDYITAPHGERLNCVMMYSVMIHQLKSMLIIGTARESIVTQAMHDVADEQAQKFSSQASSLKRIEDDKSKSATESTAKANTATAMDIDDGKSKAEMSMIEANSKSEISTLSNSSVQTTTIMDASEMDSVFQKYALPAQYNFNGIANFISRIRELQNFIKCSVPDDEAQKDFASLQEAQSYFKQFVEKIRKEGSFEITNRANLEEFLQDPFGLMAFTDSVPENIRPKVCSFFEQLGLNFEKLESYRKNCSYFAEHPEEVAILGMIERDVSKVMHEKRACTTADDVMSLMCRSERIYATAASYYHLDVPFHFCFSDYAPFKVFDQQQRGFTDTEGDFLELCSTTHPAYRATTTAIPQDHYVAQLIQKAALEKYNEEIKGAAEVVPGKKATRADFLIPTRKKFAEDVASVEELFHSILPRPPILIIKGYGVSFTLNTHHLNVVLDVAIQVDVIAGKVLEARIFEINPGFDKEAPEQMTIPNYFSWQEIQKHQAQNTARPYGAPKSFMTGITNLQLGAMYAASLEIHEEEASKTSSSQAQMKQGAAQPKEANTKSRFSLEELQKILYPNSTQGSLIIKRKIVKQSRMS